MMEKINKRITKVELKKLRLNLSDAQKVTHIAP